MAGVVMGPAAQAIALDVVRVPPPDQAPAMATNGWTVLCGALFSGLAPWPGASRSVTSRKPPIRGGCAPDDQRFWNDSETCFTSVASGWIVTDSRLLPLDIDSRAEKVLPIASALTRPLLTRPDSDPAEL